MKIAVFVSTLHGGGAEKVAIDLAARFADRGHDVDLVVANAEGPFLGRVADDVDLVDLGAHRVRGALPPLVRYLRRRRPDAVLSFISDANAVAAAAIAIGRTRTRLVVSERSNRSRAIREMPRPQRILMRTAMRWTFRRADAVVGISAGVTGDLTAMFGLDHGKAHTIHNPVDRAGICAAADGPAGHPWLDAEGPSVVLAVGRLEPQKDFLLLVSAFARVRSARPARLVILGEGQQREQLERAVQEEGLAGDVDLPGFVDNVPAHLARADVFVLSSRWEGFANVVAEAVAVGTPVVSTDCPYGPAEILEDGRWGRLVPVGDAGALAAAIGAALDGQVPAAPATAVTRFSPAAITARYLELLTPDG